MDEMKLLTPRGPEGSDRRYHFHGEVTDATSDAVRLPGVGGDATVTVSPGTNATVQFTAASPKEIEDGTAVWIDWPSGEVTAPASDSITTAVGALRLISTGASTWEISL